MCSACWSWHLHYTVGKNLPTSLLCYPRLQSPPVLGHVIWLHNAQNCPTWQARPLLTEIAAVYTVQRLHAPVLSLAPMVRLWLRISFCTQLLEVQNIVHGGTSFLLHVAHWQKYTKVALVLHWKIWPKTSANETSANLITELLSFSSVSHEKHSVVLLLHHSHWNN